MIVNGSTRRDPESEIIGVVGVGQDVTEVRRKEQELRKMQCLQATHEAKVETERNMTAYFAHELRNPLNAIDNALTTLPDDLPVDAKEMVESMRLCSAFMSNIMNSLLDVRKMEEGKMVHKNAPMSVNALMFGVYSMLKSSVKPGVDYRMVCNVDDGRDWVPGDQHRMQQVFVNVTTNAIKYTKTGSIVLSISWENDMVKYECIDTGPGIPKSEQDVCALFARLPSRSTLSHWPGERSDLKVIQLLGLVRLVSFAYRLPFVTLRTAQI